VQPTDPLAIKLLADTNPPISLLLKAIFPPTRAGRTASKAYVARVGTWPGLGPDAFTTATATVAAQTRAEGPLCRIPGAKLTLYRGAGHAHLFQFNGRYAGEVNGFLAAP
jgi:hypothetical protein